MINSKTRFIDRANISHPAAIVRYRLEMLGSFRKKSFISFRYRISLQSSYRNERMIFLYCFCFSFFGRVLLLSFKYLFKKYVSFYTLQTATSNQSKSILAYFFWRGIIYLTGYGQMNQIICI